MDPSESLSDRNVVARWLGRDKSGPDSKPRSVSANTLAASFPRTASIVVLNNSSAFLLIATISPDESLKTEAHGEQCTQRKGSLAESSSIATRWCVENNDAVNGLSMVVGAIRVGIARGVQMPFLAN